MGSLDVWKEWTYAGDAVEAAWLLVNQDRHHEIVIGSGVPHSIQQWVEECFRLAGLNWSKHVFEERGFRPEYPMLYSNPARLRSLGWQPQVSFTELARIMIGARADEYGAAFFSGRQGAPSC